MSGQGETCTHVASVLFYIETSVRIRGATPTCTGESCQWIIPSYLKSVEYLPIEDIDFTSARGKKRKLDDAIDSNETTSEPQQSTVHGTESTESELEDLFHNLSCGGTKPLVLSLVPQYSDSYVPKSSLESFPKPLKSLQQSQYLKLSYNDLLDICESTEIQVTDDMAKAVEKETRSQSSSKLWYTYRAGRVTASRMKAVCHTNVANPSQSLIKSICYPEAYNFFSKQTEWGCKHEKKARDLYYKLTAQYHCNLQIADSGLVINTNWPFIGASPDGIVSCDCHGKGVVEIKCPYCHKGSSVVAAAQEDPKFCLKEIDGRLCLDTTHSYYYQVQTQLFVCNVEYSDFVVCTFASDHEDSIHMERLNRNNEFWQDCLDKARLFFKICLLPELLGSWYTRPTEFTVSAASADTSVDVQPVYCSCCGPEQGIMIACDNPDCRVEWFHLECLHLEVVPSGKWYCPDCRKLPQFLKSKSKKK